MLAGLFRSNRPAVLAILLVLVPLFFLPSWSAVAWPERTVMPLQNVVQHLLQPGWMRGLAGMLLLLLLCIQINALVVSTELMERRNHLPALFFPILLAAFGDGDLLSPAMLGMPFVLFALRRTWSISNMGSALGPLFDAGILLGVAGLFFLPYVFLLVVVWSSASVIRPFVWRDYLVPALGCAVAFYAAWAVLELNHSGPWNPMYTVIEPSEPARVGALIHQRMFLYIVLAGMLMAGGSAFARTYQRGVMREKNLRSSFLAFLFALGVLVVLLWLLSHRFPAVLLAVPLAVICAYAVQTGRRGWAGETAVALLVVLGLWAQWGS